MPDDATPAFLPSRFPGLSRRYSLAFSSGFPAAAGIAFAPNPAPDPPAPGPDFPRQESDTVREAAGACHFNFARLKALVSARPAPALASWDWGFGDWETALGAASNSGRVDIALFLMERGARPDLFPHEMLGHLG